MAGWHGRAVAVHGGWRSRRRAAGRMLLGRLEKEASSLWRHKIALLRANRTRLSTTSAVKTMSSTASHEQQPEVDPQYPGTAVTRMRAARERAASLSTEQLSQPWAEVRRRLLWAAGLKDDEVSRPGQGYTGHAFNDYNHCDATTMSIATAHNENEGRVSGIHRSNPLGVGILKASLPELGPGGTWSTCMQGCHTEPPRDVAHVQFQSRIAFKLVWCPPDFSSLVLVDDGGELLAGGTPTGSLPPLIERRQNYALCQGSKYATAAEKYGVEAAGPSM